MKAVVAAFNQEKALVGAFSVITNLRMELFGALVKTRTVCCQLWEGFLLHGASCAAPGAVVTGENPWCRCRLQTAVMLQYYVDTNNSGNIHGGKLSHYPLHHCLLSQTVTLAACMARKQQLMHYFAP